MDRTWPKLLLARGHHVTIIDDLSTGSLANVQHLIGHERFRFAIETIGNEMVLDRLASECDVIFHLAAAVGVQLIIQNPVHTIETNVMGTEAVLKAALRYRAKVLVASTSEVYGKSERVPLQRGRRHGAGADGAQPLGLRRLQDGGRVPGAGLSPASTACRW